MKWGICVVVLLSCGCRYWSGGGPRSDVAPTTWGARSATTDPVVSSKPAAEDRLQNLERLHRDGLITDGEYRERRRKVLADAFE
jgi:hypothetical protein